MDKTNGKGDQKSLSSCNIQVNGRVEGYVVTSHSKQNKQNGEKHESRLFYAIRTEAYFHRQKLQHHSINYHREHDGILLCEWLSQKRSNQRMGG